jgi:hypothetical protein
MLNQLVSRGDGAPVAVFSERPILRMLRLRAVGRRRETPRVPGHVACGARTLSFSHVFGSKTFVEGAQFDASRCLCHPAAAMRPQGDASATGILSTREGRLSQVSLQQVP